MKSSDKDPDKVKLQLFLSHSGVCSRRDAFERIKRGEVTVNGKVILEPSYMVDAQADKINLNNVLVEKKKFEYILLHKAKGFVTTKIGQFDQKTVYALLPKSLGHLVPVGRLDKDTQGLLLLTNDGDLTFKLTHPSFNIFKKYFVRCSGVLSPQDMKRLEQGVIIEGQKTAPAKIESVKVEGRTTQFFMTIHEGKKRQIRLMLEAVGKEVTQLKRISQGPISLGDLKEGQYRSLTETEIRKLKAL